MHFGEFDVSFGQSDAKKIFVRRNGAGGPLKEVLLPPHSKFADLLEKSGKALDLDAPQKAFYSNGVECTDIDHVDEDEIVHISCGEPFKASEGVGNAKLQVVGNFVLQEKLGQGGFGSVMKGVHLETGEMCAVKFVPKKSFREISDLQRVFQEIQALRNLRHPNVIRILDVADHPDSICFIMEFCAGGELRGYVERHTSLDEEESRHFFKQIVRAVHYIHTKKIIHRDLKLENILLDSKNQCKIVDFGLSDYVSSAERTVTDAGTQAYLAPEVWNGTSGVSDPYKIDVWGLGVILYALAHGRLPFSRPDHETCQRLDADGLHFSEELSSGYRHIVKIMLTPKPERRASMNEITIDVWVTQNRFAELNSMLGPDLDDEGPCPSCSSEEAKPEGESKLGYDNEAGCEERADTFPDVSRSAATGTPGGAAVEAGAAPAPRRLLGRELPHPRQRTNAEENGTPRRGAARQRAISGPGAALNDANSPKPKAHQREPCQKRGQGPMAAAAVQVLHGGRYSAGSGGRAADASGGRAEPSSSPAPVAAQSRQKS